MSPPPRKEPARHVPRASFHSVAVVVSDRKRSLTWYTKNLGLDVIQQVEGQDGHWVTVGRQGQNGTLHLCQFSEFDPEAPLEPGTSGIQFTLPGNFEDSCRALEANGVRFTHPARQESWGWWAQVADPDGNEIMLIPE